MKDVQILAYSGCDTCRKALKWLAAKGIEAKVRPIVDEPPTLAELDRWIPASGQPIKKWLNTSGQSYRALDKEEAAAADEKTWKKWLLKDGKLVKRPVLVTPAGVRVGFREAEWEALLGSNR